MVIAESNEEVVTKSDIVFLGLLPDTAFEILPKMPFRDEQVVCIYILTDDYIIDYSNDILYIVVATVQIISMMAAIDYETLLLKTGTAMAKTVRTVPLPSSAVRTGPILSHPPNDEACAILTIVGTVVQCTNEAEMKPLISITGHISHFYEMMHTMQGWAVENGT